MDENTSDADQRMVQEIAGKFGAPSFMRRANLVETSWASLVSELDRRRKKQLEMVSLRLAQLRALAGDWQSLAGWSMPAQDLAALERLHDELQPRLRMPLEPTRSRRQLRSALQDLLDAMEAFNRRWSRTLAKIDLTRMNEEREAYNRYYLLEKECSLGSARVARIGFKRLEPITVDDLTQHSPLLQLPRLTQ